MPEYQSKPGIPDAWNGVYNLRPNEPGTMLGTINLLGRPHHVLCVRVKGGLSGAEGDAGAADLQQPYCDNDHARGWYEDIQDLVGQGYLTPIEIPGLPGQWAVAIHPYVD